ncbi:hypothetical protein MLD38_028102 [Melastoma candidum]|uniref:Uncharacterized protein n=1 Tax=Melastoma candidum TaxID=119954 RepID=A0ACB9N278_9MYRT|nr:hypothetical protein MLD38_028102 [Melastoma candidum]
MGVVTVGVAELKPSVSGRRSLRPSSSARRAVDWPISEVSSDLTVEVGKSTFSLHKFPLVSRSGRILKLLAEPRDPRVMSRINLGNVPGGPEAFELAAKFCYGINVEFTLLNVAMCCCAARYLEMTEEIAERNLLACAEAYLKDYVTPSISSSIAVLHRCESVLPTAEEMNLVSRLVNAIANNACKEQLTSGLSKLDRDFSAKPVGMVAELEKPADWWGKSLAVLSLDLFQRVISAVKSKGLKQDTIAEILIHYANNSLQLVSKQTTPLQTARGSNNSDLEKKQRGIVEAIVSLLPTHSRKSPIPVAFLSSLLKVAVRASASASCRSDLERRMGLQLDEAILENILVPAANSTIYDTDPVCRIFSNFLKLEEEDDQENRLGEESDMFCDFESPGSPRQISILKVSKLLDSYLAEVALDPNLSPAKFTALAEILPDHARVTSDGLYRAVDIFLKVHPNMKDPERYRLCKNIDCQKLSPVACSHAAQNDRLPVQTAVQVLYFEQMRLRNAMNGGPFPNRSVGGSGVPGSGTISPRDNYASVRRENRELKLEVARMRMRLTDLEKDHASMKQELVRPHRASRLIRSFTRRLRKLKVMFRRSTSNASASKGDSDNGSAFRKRRHYSFS